MSLHSTPYDRQVNRVQPVPLSVPEQTVQPSLLVASQSFDGSLAQDSGWVLSETLVFDPMTDWLADRSGEVADRSQIPLCN
jgi:hypothetical protein